MEQEFFIIKMVINIKGNLKMIKRMEEEYLFIKMVIYMREIIYMIKKNGRGSLNYQTGDKYIGYWKNDTFYGKGIFYYKNSEIYEGDWADNKKKVKEYFILKMMIYIQEILIMMKNIEKK